MSVLGILLKKKPNSKATGVDNLVYTFHPSNNLWDTFIESKSQWNYLNSSLSVGNELCSQAISSESPGKITKRKCTGFPSPG